MTELFNQLLQIGSAFTNLVFVRVTRTIVKDEDVLAFTGKDNTTQWSDEPTFEKERRRFTPAEWEKADKSCKYFFGFAECSVVGPQSVFFDSKHHYSSCGAPQCHPAIISTSDQTTPPKVGDVLIGRGENSPKGIRMNQWHRVHPQARVFVDTISGLRSFDPTKPKEIEETFFVQAQSDEDRYNYVDLARLLAIGDYQYFLDLQRVCDQTKIPQRFQDRGGVDQFVHDIADMYGEEIWQIFKRMMIAQGIKSKLIPTDELINSLSTVFSAALSAKS